MSERTDGILAVIVLMAFTGGLAVTSAPLSVPSVAIGGLGTLAFEAVAFSNSDVVSHYWERRVVQAGTLAGAFAIVGVGIVVAPSSILSAGIGSLTTYLLFLSFVLVSRS
ncbi:hypothetical protein [Natrinema halophilum]|uniref:Uncharacterized protein n=1 Tax=Natrinema halophilum TaxID=1699371 RepID=A0A7D5K6K4_9EURY|nr:hypothetical protein [Natrinema halophilum]QLG49223.1 hypothetical protein HYG82_10320 [Natrinema halophilum]